MPVYIGGNLLEPAPLVNITQDLIVAGNQTQLGSTYTLSIQGTLMGWMGSPQGGSLNGSSWGGYQGLFWQGAAPAPSETVLQLHKLYNLEVKQRALEALFATNGQTIQWQSPDGSQPMQATFKNARVQFPEGVWAQVCPYTVTAECDLLYLNGNTVNHAPSSGLVQSAGESWDIQLGEAAKTFSIQHQVNAVGKTAFNVSGVPIQPAWKNAKDFVMGQLVLGWSGVSPYSNIDGGTIFSQSSLASGALSLSTYSPYNLSRVETIDELAGSYSVTETFLLSPISSGSHIYTVSTRRIVDDPYTTVVSNIQGTIHGYYDGLFNYDQRIAAASYVWNSLGGPTGLLPLITSTYTGYTYNIQPRQGSIDYNINEGTLNYNYEFSNQLYHADAFDQWTVSRKTSAFDYISVYGINGVVKGRRYDGDTNVLAPFQRAYTYFSSLSGNYYDVLYNRILSSTYFPEASGIGLQPFPITKNIDINEAEGTISYSIEFNNRFNDSNQAQYNSTVQETYRVNQHFSVDDGVTVYIIQGEVKGLNTSDINPRTNKFGNASAYYSGYVLPNMYNRIVNYYGVQLPNPNPLSTEVGYDVVEGVITYNFEYRNTFPPLLPGVLSEHITVSEYNNNQFVNTIASIPIPGRGSGPILQDMNTTAAKTRAVNVEAVLTPTGGPNFISCFNTRPNYDTFVLQLKPANGYCTNWTPNWDWKNGRFSLTAEWTYT